MNGVQSYSNSFHGPFNPSARIMPQFSIPGKHVLLGENYVYLLLCIFTNCRALFRNSRKTFCKQAIYECVIDYTSVHFHKWRSDNIFSLQTLCLHVNKTKSLLRTYVLVSISSLISGNKTENYTQFAVINCTGFHSNDSQCDEIANTILCM